MSPPRVFLHDSSAAGPGTEFRLSAEDSRHLLTVLRLRPGASVVAVDPQTGKAFDATLVKVEDTQAVIGLTEEIPLEKAGVHPCLTIHTLLCPLLKGHRNDFVTDMAVELGVRKLIFWQAERSVVKLRSEDVPSRVSRWKKIAEAAAKQSQKNYLPEVEFGHGIGDAIGRAPGTLIFGSLRPEAPPIARVVANLPLRGESLHLILGPEGDFTEKEELAIANRGGLPVSFGSSVYRSEVAALVGIVSVMVLGSSR